MENSGSGLHCEDLSTDRRTVGVGFDNEGAGSPQPFTQAPPESIGNGTLQGTNISHSGKFGNSCSKVTAGRGYVIVPREGIFSGIFTYMIHCCSFNGYSKLVGKYTGIVPWYGSRDPNYLEIPDDWGGSQSEFQMPFSEGLDP